MFDRAVAFPVYGSLLKATRSKYVGRKTSRIHYALPRCIPPAGKWGASGVYPIVRRPSTNYHVLS